MTEIAGYAADYRTPEQTLCYGFGETLAVAHMRANYQIAGATHAMQAIMRGRIAYRPVGPDEASEILEMLETPW